MKLVNHTLWAIVLSAATALSLSVVGCSDDPGVENYYSQTREYASDYLKNRSQYTKFLEILNRATGERNDLRLVDMLGTYGTYTVFAPTNEAVDEYLVSRGLGSVSELSKEDCDTIALNSIIEMTLFTTDYNEGEYPKSNMLERIVAVKSLQEWDEAKQDSVLAMYINQTAKITHADDSVSNGVVHTVGSIVNSNNNLLGAVILADSTCLIYGEALTITGMLDSLQAYKDDTYGWASDKDRVDSCTWTNDKLCIPTAKDEGGNGGEYDNVAYPEKRYFNFTMFVCPDSILKEKYGVENLDDLRQLARDLYEPVYPEDADVNDETDRRNYLNRFISYHILNRYGAYYTLTANDNHELANCFNRRKYDINDWYETLMPHSLMKFSFPSGTFVGLYINRRAVQSRADERGVYEPGTRVFSPTQVNVDQTSRNGVYHYIDGVVAYDRTMQQVVMDDVIRLDATTLSPDFMTKLTDGETPRGHSWRNGDRYSYASNTGTAASNASRAVGFKPGYVRNFSYTPQTHMHVRCRSLNFWSYEGDEVLFKGRYDVTIKLPPVPAGTYEVRMMTCVGFATRGIIQYYLGTNPNRLEPQGIPFDMRPDGVALFGWTSDDDLGDEDAIAAFDKSVHNLGWMKGPKCYHHGQRTSFSASEPNTRSIQQAIRRIIGTITCDGQTDQYLRIQQKMESENNELPLDFIEICPSSVYNNEYFAEPLW